MLTHKVLTRVDTAKTAAYYGDGADDYYAKDGNSMEWQGQGAKALGLSGEVEKERFKELLNGKISEKEKINRPSKSAESDRTVRTGVDFTFSAPKSVSIQSLVAGDGRIISAHDKAVSRVIDMAEKLAQARTKSGGKTTVETTGNLVVGKFRHETNREKEPQLHTHAVIMNMTQRADGKWRALRNDELIKATKYLGAAYRAELAKELNKLGYELRHERDGMFEIAQISRGQLEQFSTRSKQVEEQLEKKGLTRETATTEQKQLATLQSRKAKTNDDRESIYKGWREQAKEAGIDLSGRPDHTKDYSVVHEINQQVENEAARRAVRYALNHHTERTAVVAERDLMDTALKHGIGSASYSAIRKEMDALQKSGYLIRGESRYSAAEPGIRKKNDPKTRDQWVQELKSKGMDDAEARARVKKGIQSGGLQKAEPVYTTQTALARERSILKIERDGRGKMGQIYDKEQAAWQFVRKGLTPGQRDAAELIITTENRVVGIQGLAGTGKTYMLQSAKKPLEDAGYKVKALAPYGSQVKALRQEGMNAKTVASWVKARDKEIDNRTVLVIDEAGVVPARQMEQVLKLAEKAGARVVLLGDKEQTKAIEAGRPFDQLQAAGMPTAKMGDIQRQKEADLKQAVELAADGKARQSVALLRDVQEIKDAYTRRDTIANDYVALAPEERDKTVIVSGTNEARRELNDLIREKLDLTGKGVEFDTLIRRDTTQAERRFAKNYRIGDVIQPEKDYASGLTRGEIYKVMDKGPGNRLTVQPLKLGREQEKPEPITFNPSTHKHISVYQPQRAELAVGDRIRITRNDKNLDLANGDKYQVKAVKENQVTLSDGNRRVTLTAGQGQALHLDHAYATTVHSSQGLTADRVMIDADTKSRTTARDVYYVAISRARYHASVYTDDKSKLPKAVSRENVKSAALDIMKKRTAGHEHAQERQHGQERGRAAHQPSELGR